MAPGIHVHQHSLSRTNSDASVVFATSPLQHQHQHQHQQQQVRLESPLVHSLRVVGKPPSPSPSDRSLPPFSSGSSVSEASTGSGGSNTVGPGEPEFLFDCHHTKDKMGGAVAEWSKALKLREKINRNQKTPGSPPPCLGNL